MDQQPTSLVLVLQEMDERRQRMTGLLVERCLWKLFVERTDR